MRKLIKNIIIIVTLLILQAGVTMAQLHYGTLAVNGKAPEVSALTFTAYVNGDDNYLMTEKFINHYRSEMKIGMWQLNTYNFINEAADTSGTLSINFHANSKTKAGNIAISSTGTIRTDFVLDQEETVGQPSIAVAAGDNKVVLTWAAVSGATSYRVYRNSGRDNGCYARISNEATSPYVDSTVSADTTYNYIVVAIGNSARGAHSLVVTVNPSEISQVLKDEASSAGISGTPMNYPNPFAPSVQSTTINYSLTKDTDIKLYIYDLTRKQIYGTVYAAGSNGGRLGENEISWDGKDMLGQLVANGVYVYFITSGGKVVGSGEVAVYE